jgi:DNA-binding beta-propeller fold protein YncE
MERKTESRGRANAGKILGLTVAVGALLMMMYLPSAVAAQPVLKAVPTSCTVGSGPEFPGYDPVTHEMYIPNAKSSTITVLKGTCTKAATIKLPAGAYPVQAAFDPSNNHMYVTDNLLDQVYDISGTKVVATITGFYAPWGITYDPGDSVLVVGNLNQNYVSFIQGTVITSTANTGSSPSFITYDPYYGNLLITNGGSSNVTILNAITLGHVGDVAVGCHPGGAVFDYADNLDYIANSCSNNVTVMTGYGAMVATLGGFKVPDGVGWDQANLEVYVANFGSDKVFAISGTHIVARNVTVAGAQPLGVGFNEANNEIYVANFNSNTVYLFS